MFQYCLREVIAVLEGRDYEQAFRALGERLAEDGISLVLGSPVEESREASAGSYSEREEIKPAEGGLKCARERTTAAEAQRGALYITDLPQWAEKECRKGRAVLAFARPGAGEWDFTAVPYGMERPEELDAGYLDRVYRRLAGIPWDILETERCLVRETIEEDVDSFCRIYSDPAITEFTEALYPSADMEKEYVREYRRKFYAFYQFGVWTVLLKSTGEIIGRAGYSLREGFELPELGFLVGAPWQRRGLATEVCRAILAYGGEELGFEQVQALVMPDNRASLRLLAALGFQGVERVRLNHVEYLRMEAAIPAEGPAPGAAVSRRESSGHKTNMKEISRVDK